MHQRYALEDIHLVKVIAKRIALAEVDQGIVIVHHDQEVADSGSKL